MVTRISTVQEIEPVLRDLLSHFLALPRAVADQTDRLNAITRSLAGQSGALVSIAREIESTAGEQEQLDSIRASLQTLLSLQAETSKSVNALVQRTESLEFASAERAQLSERYFFESVIDPLTRCLLPIHDLVRELTARSQSDENSALLESIGERVIELLSRYGIERFEQPVGSRFESKTMRALTTQVTENRQLVNSVAALHQAGFARGAHVLRFQGVSVYQASQVLAPVR